jgi:LysM repeat protein
MKDIKKGQAQAVEAAPVEKAPAPVVAPPSNSAEQERDAVEEESSWFGPELTGFAPEMTEPDAEAPEPADAPGTHRTIAKGDTLWDIAEEVYGDPHRWTELYEQNKDVLGDNPDLIYPGQTIVIGGRRTEVPEDPEVLEELLEPSAPAQDEAPDLPAPDEPVHRPEAPSPLPISEVEPNVPTAPAAPHVPDVLVDAPRAPVAPEEDHGPVIQGFDDVVHTPGAPAPLDVPTLDPALERPLSPGEAHDEAVRELLGDAYGLEPTDPALTELTRYVDPTATRPEASDYFDFEFGTGLSVLDEEYEELGGFDLETSVGENAVGSELDVRYGPVQAAIEANNAWDQAATDLVDGGGRYTAAGNAVDFLGGPVAAASETDAWDWRVGAGGTIRGFGLEGEVNAAGATVSTAYSAIQNFPVPGLLPSRTDPASQAARQAYIDAHPEAFEEWMAGRRDAILGGAESLSGFDWRNLGEGEAASFSEFGADGFEVGAAYGGVGVNLGRGEETVDEVTVASPESGVLDIAITSMDRSQVDAAVELAGALSVGGSGTDGDVSQIRFRIDTTTEEGQAQADAFMAIGILPGAMEGLEPEEQAAVEEWLGYHAAQADYPGQLRAPTSDIQAIVGGANASFLETHEEAEDLPVAGATSYENLELAEISGGGVRAGIKGLGAFEANREQILSENRYRNSEGETETEFGVTTAVDTEWSFLFLGGGSDYDSFATTNPEFNEDLALYAGIVGDYDTDLEPGDGEEAAYTVSLYDDQMAGLEDYLDTIGAADSALFSEEAAAYYFNGATTYGGGLGPTSVFTPYEDRGPARSYTGHDGEEYDIGGALDGRDALEFGRSQDALVRARAFGMGDRVLLEAAELLAEEMGESLDDYESLEEFRMYHYDRLERYENEVAVGYDGILRDVTSVAEFQAIEDPQLQSAYILSAADRLAREEQNPALAFSLAFELEDPEQRNEVIRTVLAAVPQEGAHFVGDLVEDAMAHDLELAALLEGAIEEGLVPSPDA